MYLDLESGLVLGSWWTFHKGTSPTCLHPWTNLLQLLIADETEALQSESILNIEYGISGSRTVGAHAPVTATPAGVEAPSGAGPLLFRSALLLQKPVLNPCLAVGFLPFPTVSLRVGQLVTMRWRVERLKDLEEKISNNVSLEKLCLLGKYIYKKCAGYPEACPDI